MSRHHCLSLRALLLAALFALTHPLTAADPPPSFKLTPELLDQSINLTRQFLLLNQKQGGNFEYLYDIEQGVHLEGDSQVRQAGTLWGMSLVHRQAPSQLTKDAMQAGLSFFAANSVHDAERGRYIIYGEDRLGDTGTMALLVLAHLEFLASDTDFSHTESVLYRRLLSQYFQFLIHLRLEDGHFVAQYLYNDDEPQGLPSPYFDGEALLAVAKAARFLNNPHLRDFALHSAEAMYQRWVLDARANDPDSSDTKGFYQWGSLAFYELYLAGWGDSEAFAERTIELAHWMIDTHRVLERQRNTAYAYEGLIVACDLARRTGDLESFTKLYKAIDQGLYRLMTWQVGGPVENDYLAKLKVREPIAIGGVLNHASEPYLRIDVAQHQLHALLLARRLLFGTPP